MSKIELTQKPVIKHDLISVGQNVTNRIEALNIENLVATNDTIKSMKSLRAELNKEAKEFEAQRRAVKEAVNTPYSEFEAIYKEEVISKYNGAIEILKDKIGSFETKIKEEKQANIERYFTELCQVEKIDFLKFGQLNLDINLSTSEKKYKEQCNEFVLKVQDDIKLIESEEFQAEIMTEYKSTLNASRAITTVKERKEKEKQEKERILQARTNKRESHLKSMGLTYSEIVKSFILPGDDSVFIKQSDIKNLSDDDFRKTSIEIETKARATKTEIKTESSPVHEIKKPLEAPVESKKEEVFEASFQASGTMAQLKALGEYMKSNNIIYKNI